MIFLSPRKILEYYLEISYRYICMLANASYIINHTFKLMLHNLCNWYSVINGLNICIFQDVPLVWTDIYCSILTFFSEFTVESAESGTGRHWSRRELWWLYPIVSPFIKSWLLLSCGSTREDDSGLLSRTTASVFAFQIIPMEWWRVNGERLHEFDCSADFSNHLKSALHKLSLNHIL
jgi:hypothetical protein